MAAAEASFSNLPPELIAHTVSFLQTADTHDVCFGGRTNHLDRLRRRADSLCREAPTRNGSRRPFRTAS